MAEISNSKTYFFMENESGDISFAARYNVTRDGKQSDGKVMLDLPQYILTAVEKFVKEDVIPEINKKEK